MACLDICNSSEESSPEIFPTFAFSLFSSCDAKLDRLFPVLGDVSRHDRVRIVTSSILLAWPYKTRQDEAMKMKRLTPMH